MQLSSRRSTSGNSGGGGGGGDGGGGSSGCGGGSGGGGTWSVRLLQDAKGRLAARAQLSRGGACRWTACADWERRTGPGVFSCLRNVHMLKAA